MRQITRAILWTLASIAGLAFLLQVDSLYADYRRASRPVETVAQRLAPNAMRDMVVRARQCDRLKEDSSWVTVYDLMLYNRSEFHCYDTIKVKVGYMDQYNGELAALKRIVTVHRTIPPGDSVWVGGVRSGPATDRDFLKIDGGLVEIIN